MAGSSVSSVVCVVDNPTVRFAGEELSRCLGIMTGQSPSVVSGGQANDGIALGLMSDLGIKAPDVPDPELDDAIYIDVRDGRGMIAGINPRSVLLAVYRYLTELGCRWVRPGMDGEYIPRLENILPVKLEEKASYRHRGVCIEGAVSLEHVRDMIDWMPKVGFNAYFTQFRESHTFYDRWYSHEGNPFLEGKDITVEDSRRFTSQVISEIRKRDLIYHAVGHGWTCEPFGISGLGWEKYDEEPPAQIKQYLAQLDGERKFWYGVPLNTNLCYGNPKVRELVVDEIVDYAGKHPEIDILHFWLADGSNNNCECELCRDTRPSDFFVQMLNDLDKKLSAKGIPTRIVFLIYVDLLWPAEHQKIENPDRFILMFAPITRTYSQAFTAEKSLPELPPFVRNKLKFPNSVEENVAFLRAWQKDFKGDSFDFDYHMMWDHYKDPGYMPISNIIGLDMKGLRDIGLNGNVSCQVQRAFFPTGLPMTVMGKTLWDSSLTCENIASDYFTSAFGPDGKLCLAYLKELSELFDPVYIRGEKPEVNDEAAAKLKAIPGVIEEFMPVIERNLESSNPCWVRSWFYMKHHGRICGHLAPAYEALARGDKPAAQAAWEQVKVYVQEHEMEIHPALDVSVFIGVLGGRFA